MFWMWEDLSRTLGSQWTSKSTVERNPVPTYTVRVRRHSVRIPTYWSSGDTQERNPKRAMTVTKLSTRAPTLQHIQEVRGHPGENHQGNWCAKCFWKSTASISFQRRTLSGINVEKPLVRAHTLQYIREFSQENSVKCHACAKAFSQSSHITSHQTIHTEEKSYKYNGYCKFSTRTHILKNTI